MATNTSNTYHKARENFELKVSKPSDGRGWDITLTDIETGNTLEAWSYDKGSAIRKGWELRDDEFFTN